jgi:hypothetical protein
MLPPLVGLRPPAQAAGILPEELEMRTSITLRLHETDGFLAPIVGISPLALNIPESPPRA